MVESTSVEEVNKHDDDDDLYIIGAVCPSRFSLFHFLPFLDTFGSKNMRKSV